MSVDSGDGARRTSFLRMRALSVIVLVVAVGLSVAASLATRQVVHDQEHKLLKQRTDEAALYLASVLGTVDGALASIGTGAAATNYSPAQFAATNRLLTADPKQGFRTIALIATTPTPHVVAHAGADITDLSPRLAAVQQATSHAVITSAYATTEMIPVGGGQRAVGFAYSAPQLANHVIYAEFVISAQTSSATSGQPFSELAAAVYVVPRVQADQLLTVSAGTHAPLTGLTARATAKVGTGQPWLLVAKARHPLVGSVAANTWWILLVIGIGASLLAMSVVETLARRRDYADDVAAQRTQELTKSLTDLAAAHEQLVRQERLAAIGELASTIGHELRNPLGVISNALYLLRSDIAAHPTEAAQRHLATADREVSAATVIVSDLLEFARQRDPVMTEVDAVVLLDEVLAVLPPPSGITVDRQVPVAHLDVIADRDMLRQVLLNFIGNAYQAMPDGGRVTVSLRDEHNAVQLRVADTGVGMSDEVKDNLFQPFFTTKARGVGLGLAVSKRIVDAHSGRIEVRSAPGQGAEFIVTLPQIMLPRQQTPHHDVPQVTPS